MRDKRDWLAPWINLAGFLNVILSHTVAASALIGIHYFGQLVTDKYMHAEDTVLLKGTGHEFTPRTSQTRRISRLASAMSAVADLRQIKNLEQGQAHEHREVIPSNRSLL